MPIPSVEAELELKTNAVLGECPVWDDTENKLYWVDILSGVVNKYDPTDKTNTEYEVGEHVGALALRQEGGLVLATKTGYAFFNPDSGKFTNISDPEIHLPNNRFNDGKCDTAGRFWAGTLSYEQQQGAGSLYCLNTNLSVDLRLRQLTIPNGMAWDQDSDKFYFIDSRDRALYSFDYNHETGEINHRSVVTIFGKEGPLPDGMTMDTNGKLWVAMYNGYKVKRVDPETGDTLQEITLPVPQVTSCTFGGPEMNELFITTAREHMSDEDVEEYPLSGSLFKVELPETGHPPTRFGG